MDWNKIEQLLNIGKVASEHGPKYTPIVSAVQLELEQHLAEAKKVVEDQTQQAVDRRAKIDSDAKAAADAGNVGDATEDEDEKTETPVVRRV